MRDALEARLAKHARARWQGRCRAVIVRFRGRFAYVDAIPDERPSQATQIRNAGGRIEPSLMHLCRLGYLGRLDRWEYAFFKYSDMKYELSVVASGSFVATPEQAFDCSAGVYLHG